MTYTFTANNFLLTNSESSDLISMPSHFTNIEAGFLEKSIQQFYNSCSSTTSEQDSLSEKKIVVDFGSTTFMDNGGLMGLCKILRFAKANKIALSFMRFSPQVKMILSLAGIEEFFPLEDNK
ncbi:MAG: STAS domain-containing protein [Cyanobacteria bacterium J06621_8]